MGTRAERGMSAPPEVVFNTATDPDRASATSVPNRSRQWKPSAVPPRRTSARLARWSSGSAPGWSAEIQVEPADAGGSRVRLDLTGGDNGLADETLANLAREVADNLTAG